MTRPAYGTAWRVKTLTGFDGVDLDMQTPVPQLGDHDCLVKMEAASLNFRDLMIPKVSPFYVQYRDGNYTN
jgi:NADPH:quinone reductase-like Zn-dependent oxidoreductase